MAEVVPLPPAGPAAPSGTGEPAAAAEGAAPDGDIGQEAPPSDTEAPSTSTAAGGGRDPGPAGAPQLGVYRPSRHEGTGLRAIGFRPPGLPALAEALQIGRALRPLLRRLPSARQLVLDEDETVRRIAEERIWLPVFVPLRARWTELALVVDANETMQVWHPTLDELRRLLERHGAFRDVRTWRLDAAGAPRLVAASHSVARHAERSVRELQDPAGRRVILLASDCMGPSWRDGRMHAVMQDWGRQGPLALLQLLPPRMWPRTPLGLPPLRLAADLPGVANSHLRIIEVSADRRAQDVSLALPVITLDAGEIGRWAEVLTGHGGATVPGVRVSRFRPRPPEPAWETEPASPPEATIDARERVRRFGIMASGPARQLAAYLTAVPLSLPIMRLVQQLMLPDSRHTHLAEVLLGGLIRPLPGIQPDDPDDVEYEFHDPAIRDLLREGQTAEEATEVTRRVIEAISDFIAGQQGRPSSFSAALLDEGGTGPLTLPLGSRPFAQLGAEALRRYGGAYASLADRLAAGWERAPELGLGLRGVLGGGRESVEQAAWSPNGELLAAAFRDAGIRIWTLAGEESHRLSGSRLCWHPDGRRLAVASADGNVRLWDVTTWKPGQESAAQGSPIRSLDWSSDGRSIASATGDGILLQVWDLSRGAIRTARLPGPIRQLAWSGDWIAAAAGDRAIVWDRVRGTIAARLPGSGAKPRSVVWSGDGELLLVGDGDGRIAVWRIARMVSAARPDPVLPAAPLHVLTGHATAVTALAFDNSGQLLASLSADGTVRIWRTDQWRCVADIPGAAPKREATALSFHPRLPVLVTPDDGGTALRLWDVRLRPRRRPMGPQGPHVLMLMWEIPPLVVGGVWTACYHLVRNLERLGQQVTVVVPWERRTVLPDPFGNGVAVVPLGMIPPGDPAGPAPGVGDAWSSYGGAPVAWSAYGSYGQPFAWSSYAGRPGPWSAYGSDPESIAWSSYGGYPGAWSSYGGYPTAWSSYGGYPGAWSVYGGYPAVWSAYGGYRESLARSSYGTGFPSWSIYRAAWSGYGGAPGISSYAGRPLSASVLFQVIGDFRDRLETYVREHPADVIHAHDWVTFDAARVAAAQLAVPWIAHFHSTEADRRPDGGDPLIERIEQGAVNTATRVVAPSGVTRQRLVDRYNAVEARVAVVPNPLSPEETPPAERGSFASKRVIFVGRLTRQKGVDRFCDVAAAVRRAGTSASFEVFGDGEMRASLRDRPVVWRGPVGWNERGRAFGGASIVIVPSRAEPFGMVVLEAMQHRVPVIYPADSGAAEVFRSGIPVRAGDVAAIAAHVIRLLQRHKDWTDVVRAQSAEIATYLRQHDENRLIALWREATAAPTI
jgi:WD40 repeat protein/glycosyltransferase involved in cell wall biosynthesis